MPLYEYECTNSHRFEKIQKFSDPPVTACPTCGASVHKLMSSPAIQFKGSGWYITDYPKKDSTTAGKGDKAESASETKADAKAETKSESKSDPKTAPTANAKADKA